MEIMRCNKEESELPIEIILPHNRALKGEKKGNENSYRKSNGVLDLNKMSEENLLIAEKLRINLGQSIQDVLESCHK